MIKTEKATDTFKLLSDPTRVKILSLLFKHKFLCVNDIARGVGASHSAVSHQLGKLESREIVSCVRDGKNMCYSVLDNEFTDKLKKALAIFNK